MASWQPPIPSGALYSKPARELGAGVVLLAYLYDKVRTDGWVEVNLHEASVAMDAPYPTVKSWWQMIKVSVILTEVQDRGRKGIRAKFDDYWLDWRTLNARKSVDAPINETSRYPETNETPTPQASDDLVKNGTSDDLVSEDTEQSGVNRELIGSFSRSSGIPNGRMYKVLHTDQESITHPARKKRTDENLSDHQKIMATYQECLGYPIANGGKEGKAASGLVKQGYTAEQVRDCYQYLRLNPFYDGKHISLQIVHGQIGAYLKSQELTNGNGQLETHQQPSVGVVRNGTHPTGNGSGAILTGAEANDAAIARSGQRPDRGVLRRLKIDW